MTRIDLVLLHAPSVYDFRERSIMFGPVSDMVPSTPIFEMYPLGFTTMAEYMERRGIRVRIVNLAVLMLNKPDFDVEAYLAKLNPVAFGIDLHWLPHAHGSVEVARVLKRLHPHTPVIFGGLSASYFHEELITYDAVDYVVRGDSTEEPMTRLMTALKGGGGIADIPNVTWKDASGAVVVNDLTWVPSDMNSISLDYSFNMKSVIRYRDMMGVVPFKDWLQYPVCASLTCRGCTHNCVTCGGSATAFRESFGRDKVAFRDPDLLVRDIQNIQKYIPGPMFVLNDFLQAGPEYTRKFVEGLHSINVKNPIGFEFFRPPNEDFYELLNHNLNDYSVEISVETHDDDVRAAFGKNMYKMQEVEDTIVAALRNGCSRFDLYFMTGIPTQTAESVRETTEYVRHLYEVVGNDSRLLCFTSPMAPFLDPGSIAFENPEAHGYTLRAKTLEEHRQRLLLPSWKHIMNYESHSMSPDEMVEATYDAAIGINRVKADIGLLDNSVADRTEKRINEARVSMARIDKIMAGPLAEQEPALLGLKKEFDRLSESTVAEKSQLNWPHAATLKNVAACASLFVSENVANLFAHGRGEMSPATSDQTLTPTTKHHASPVTPKA
ncbi:MAG: TIGR04190 family B12-binding domain/radical SAM domain protein [Coriobacteriia bacterium]|nr:TIGR04190 family B12-binding domain/radical SAM domain protein [Coriobacteriia bacterium]